MGLKSRGLQAYSIRSLVLEGSAAEAVACKSAAVCNYLHTYAGVSGDLCKDTLFLKFPLQLPKGPYKET